QALQDEGGWENKATCEAFSEYARVVFRALRGSVDLWITHNEPWVVAFTGHAEGRVAPGKRDFQAALEVSRNLLLAHGMAVQVFREEKPGGEIGIAVNLSPAHPASEAKHDREAARRYDGYLNRWFLDPIFRGQFPEDMLLWYRNKGYGVAPLTPDEGKLVSQPLDFLGINYYSRHIVRQGQKFPLEIEIVRLPQGVYSDMGWEVYPQGLYEIVQWAYNIYNPKTLYITENGYPSPDTLSPEGLVLDEERIAYLKAHLTALSKALEEGYPIRGYFVWSLMDNFEWMFGFTKRFGLVYVDYATQRRIPKQSFFWYQKVISQRTPFC
ncbi:family 1 glycosylhydrolase, partial [Candidatus Caldatribacterium sp.]|uniref:family 1 glycosylhydrolase n=1 Tax=Candidatus Caldatribacterium sp. TaxID=2282143 RepID=UPI0038485407|nr:family 1 glycosylhydrolase [Candidatus Caldatribacterium sp.]